MNKLCLLFTFFLLYGCSAVKLPSGMEDQRTFTQSSHLDYKEVYKITSKQMKGCLTGKGFFGNGYDTQALLDTENKSGSIELYYIGLSGPEESIFSHTVSIKRSGDGSVITTTGATPKYVYLTHSLITTWLEGNRSCSVNE